MQELRNNMFITQFIMNIFLINFPHCFHIPVIELIALIRRGRNRKKNNRMKLCQLEWITFDLFIYSIYCLDSQSNDRN